MLPGGPFRMCSNPARVSTTRTQPMTNGSLLEVRAEVADAVRRGRPVVALESTLIAHGLPWPLNFETAQEAEAAVRDEGGVPATIAVLAGRPTVGLSETE